MHIVVIALALLGLVGSAGAEPAVERGRYLVDVLGACGNCHTPKGPNGDLLGKALAGGFVIEESFGTAVSSNITPDPETGIGRWTDEEIVRAIREGKRRDGRTWARPCRSTSTARSRTPMSARWLPISGRSRRFAIV